MADTNSKQAALRRGEESESDSDGESSTSSDTASQPASGPASMPNEAGNVGGRATELAAGLLSVVKPSIHQLSSRLVELQESQVVLVQTIESQKSELLDSSEEWNAAKGILDRIPEYKAKIFRIKQTMAQTAALVSKTEARSEVIRGKLEEKERERSAKKVQNDAEFQKARIS